MAFTMRQPCGQQQNWSSFALMRVWVGVPNALGNRFSLKASSLNRSDQKRRNLEIQSKLPSQSLVSKILLSRDATKK
jgi:hypothetical protein